MDKGQKELIQTYFRKRNVVIGDKTMNREKYETEYILKHPEMFDIDSITLGSTRWLDDLIKHPDKFEYYNFEKNDKRFENWNIDEILKYFPQLLPLVNIDEISNFKLVDVLRTNSKLIKYIPKERLDLFNEYHKKELLIKDPDLFSEYFDINIISQDSSAVIEILMKSPKMGRIMDLTHLDRFDFFTIFKRKPKILKEFDIKKLPVYEKVMEAVSLNAEIVYNILLDDDLREIYLPDIKLTPYMIKNLAEIDGSFLKYLDLKSLSVYEVYNIIDENPILIKFFDIKAIENPVLTSMFLINHPDQYKKFDLTKIDSNSLADILIKRPELFEPLYNARMRVDERGKYDIFSRLLLYELEKIISAQPELESKLSPYIENLRKWKWR